MSVLINLLPQLHQSQLKDLNYRRLATTITSVVICLSVGIVLFLFIFTQAQSWTLSRLQKGIDERQTQIESTADLRDILTTQANLAVLPELYNKRVHMTQLFSILSSLLPADIKLASLATQGGSLSLAGEASNFGMVAKLVKALEASNLEVGKNASKSNQPHFTDVVLVSISPGQDNKTASFSITAKMSGGVTNADF